MYFSTRWPSDSRDHSFPADHDGFTKRCWLLERRLEAARNERDKWTWLSIERHNRRSRWRFSVVYGRRAARGILESSLNYGASHIESNIGVMGRGAVSRIPMGKVKSACRADVNAALIITVKWISRVSEAAMCNNCSRVCYPSEFFPDVKENLTKIVWAHAVNSLAELEKALLSGRSIGTAIGREARPGLLFVLRLLHSRNGKADDAALVIPARSNTALPGTSVSLWRYLMVALV